MKCPSFRYSTSGSCWPYARSDTDSRNPSMFSKWFIQNMSNAPSTMLKAWPENESSMGTGFSSPRTASSSAFGGGPLTSCGAAICNLPVSNNCCRFRYIASRCLFKTSS